MRLYWRVVLPFAVGLVAIMAIAAATATFLLGRQAEHRLERHLSSVAERLAGAGFELNQPLVERLKLAVDAEVLVVAYDGPVASTFPAGATAEAAGVLATVLRDVASSSRSVIVSGQRYIVVVQALDSPSGTLAFFAPLAPVAADRAAIGRTVALVLLAGLLVMLLAGHLITRSLTRPIGQLAVAADIVAGGCLEAPTPRSRVRELRALSEAFDHMVAKLRESEARLRRSERLAAMGQIVATVAHEVRNPLAAMRMMTQLVRRYHADRTQPGEACDKILTEVERLDLLVNGLLDATQGRPSTRRQPTDVGRLAADVLALMETQLAHRGIVVRYEPASDLPLVAGDGDALKQVIVNLVLNAADAMPAGGPLTIAVRRSRRGDTMGVELTVADAGTGVPAATQARAFEMFFSTKREGVGLGLALCERVVGEHDGWIALANGDVGGAVATVWLPAARASSQSPRAGRTAGQPPAGDENGGGDRTAWHAS